MNLGALASAGYQLTAVKPVPGMEKNISVYWDHISSKPTPHKQYKQKSTGNLTLDDRFLKLNDVGIAGTYPALKWTCE